MAKPELTQKEMGVLKMMNKSKKLAELQAAYMIAKAKHETVKKIDQKVRNKILAENEFYCQDTGKRIISYKNDYQIADEFFPGYCELVFQEGLKQGLKLRDANTTADYETFPALKQAEENLLNYTINHILPAEQKQDFEKVKKHWKYREQMLDLTLKLVL